MSGNNILLSSYQGFNIIVSPVGSFAYLLLVLLFLGSALIVSLWTLFYKKEKEITRLTKIIIYLVSVFSFLLLAHIPSWFGWIPGHTFIPPLERAIDSTAVILLSWLLLFPETTKTIRAVFICLISVIALFLVVSFPLYWQFPASVPFNNTYLDLIWSGIILFISLAALIWNLIKRTERWIAKSIIFGLILVAEILQIVGFSSTYDSPSAFRWISFIVFPLLFIFLADHQRAIALPQENPSAPPPLPLPHPETTPDDLSLAWAGLSSNRDKSKVPALVSRAFANSIKSDLTFFCSSEINSFEIEFSGGFNLIDMAELSPLSVSKEKIPILANALKNQELIELSKDNSFSNDLQYLAKNLHIGDPGHLLFLPLVTIEGHPFGLVFMAPFSKKQWTRHDIDFSTALANEVLPILLEYAGPASTALIGSESAVSPSLIQQLEKENRKLKAELQLVESRVLSASSDLALQNQQSKDSVASRPQEREASPEMTGHLEMELRLTLEEIARLQNSLADANIRIHNLQNQVDRPANANDEAREVIDSVVQELRQPMTSIFGYVDLFISESAGSLNSMQKKFIDRVQASTERMQILLDDLILTTNIQNKSFEINPDIINVNEVIDQALQAVNGLLREKNLSLRIDVPKKLAPITADRNSLKQILVRLLFNACVVTPNEQPITFRVKLEGNPSDAGQSKFLRIQVTDSGGGIPPEELSNVFDRQYRADKPLLKGIGDTGIGLTLAKNLVEAHGGNIWIETDPGKSSTINAMLPTKPPARRIE